MSIQENLRQVEKNIAAACERTNRARKDITLIAVSKTHPAEAVVEALRAGQTVFGENRVQELRDKTARLEGELRDAVPVSPVWHLIGTLQTNKVKYLPAIAGLTMIHSVDNARLAQEIESRFAQSSDTAAIDVLIEVNMAREETKAGLAPEDASALLKEIAGLRHIRVRGLMTIAPFTEDAETNRVYFRGLNDLMRDLNKEGILDAPMTELSMGMSGDYEVAIEEGATFVRVGTSIFGARDYAV